MKAEEVRIGHQVEPAVRDGALDAEAAYRPPEGWDAAFREMARRGDDAPLLPDDPTLEADDGEWQT